jgi:hypothetical protein
VTIRRGFSARDDPSPIEKLVATTVRQLAVPSQYRQLRNPRSLSSDSLHAGMEHFADLCATGHANDGRGIFALSGVTLVEPHASPHAIHFTDSANASLVSAAIPSAPRRQRFFRFVSRAPSFPFLPQTLSAAFFLWMLLQRRDPGLLLRTIFCRFFPASVSLILFISASAETGLNWATTSIPRGPCSRRCAQIPPIANPLDDDTAEGNSAARLGATLGAATEGRAVGNGVFLVVLNTGTSHVVTDYWVADGHLGYVSSDGSRSHIPLEALDLKNTVTQNAPRSVPFVLRSAPAQNR